MAEIRWEVGPVKIATLLEKIFSILFLQQEPGEILEHALSYVGC